MWGPKVLKAAYRRDDAPFDSASLPCLPAKSVLGGRGADLSHGAEPEQRVVRGRDQSKTRSGAVFESRK